MRPGGRLALLLAGALTLLLAGVAHGATWTARSSAAANSPALTVSGSADGLSPGPWTTLSVVISNGYPFEISVNTATVEVLDANAGCTAANLATRGFNGSVDVGPNATTAVPVSLRLLPTAPDACQGAAFPLQLGATASVDADVPATTSGRATSLARTGMSDGVAVLLVCGLGALALGGVMTMWSAVARRSRRAMQP